MITVATLFEEAVESTTPTMSPEEDAIFVMSNPPDLETITLQQGEPSTATVLSIMFDMLKQ